MLWRSDPAIEAARQHPGWAAFHRICSKAGVCFDQATQEKRRGPYEVVAFTVEHRKSYAVTFELARGYGKLPIDAVADAYRKCGRTVPGGDEALAVLLGSPAADDDFDTIAGSPVDDFDGI